MMESVFLSSIAFFFELEPAPPCPSTNRQHTIRQRMIGGFLGVRDTCAAAQNVRRARITSTLISLTSFGLDLCSFTVFHHRGEAARD